MAHVYVVSLASMADVECERDDPALRSCSDRQALEQMASPQLSDVFMCLEDMLPAIVEQKVLIPAYDNLVEEYGDDGQLDDAKWIFEGHWKPKHGRECWTWCLSDGTTEPLMLVVVQKVVLS